MLRVALYILTLLMVVDTASAYIALDGSNFFCPPNPPAGITCCEKKMFDASLLSGAVTQPRFVMECDKDESFYASFPYPSSAGANGWSEVAVVGTSTTDVDGPICIEVQGIVMPNGQSAIYLDDPMPTETTNTGTMLASGSTTAYTEGSVITDGNTWYAWNGATRSNCTATSCDNGIMTVRFTRPSSGVICNDGKTGKAYVSTIDLYQQ